MKHHYIIGNNVFKSFKLENLGDYHDLYVKSDTILLADVFENFGICVLKSMNLTLLISYRYKD